MDGATAAAASYLFKTRGFKARRTSKARQAVAALAPQGSGALLLRQGVWRQGVWQRQGVCAKKATQWCAGPKLGASSSVSGKRGVTSAT